MNVHYSFPNNKKDINEMNMQIYGTKTAFALFAAVKKVLCKHNVHGSV